MPALNNDAKPDESILATPFMRGSSPPEVSDGASSSLESLKLSRSLTSSWFTRWCVEWWLFEILSLCFSAVCMTIILAILLLYNGRPLPMWHLAISFDALLSLFSGVAKSALLLPVAEALGQLKWDWYVVSINLASQSRFT
jgi:hypothetical protein